ncbi:PGN_0703 family putative restriction endonuclease [Terriglobus roseus]|uniref:Uncharacterized protein n=1 Tax=Terriglobus roseus TaxID=392734 RepID=A0A1H4THW4_9BACT|nr:hypothetical protein [Terriglobus roseus]SEC55967.1 hypothetical protein SAMN05443244_3759 [Terriglobus roseus]
MPGRAELPEAAPRTASQLRRELSARNLALASQHAHETTYSSVASVLYREDETGNHGNFFPASYKRIRANATWSQRLAKTYTASSRIVRGNERERAELDCSNSSDALLMNIFCHPKTLQCKALQALLHAEPEAKPEFGVRVRTPIANELEDRTEVDMRLGDLLVEAKLSESNFQTARADLMARYEDFELFFDTERLPRARGQFRGYQLLRGVLAAAHHDARFAVICDGRRPDLREEWFAVVACINASALRSRMIFLTWQEIAKTLPRPLKAFLGVKYGIHS